jgi:hypothetical protein
MDTTSYFKAVVVRIVEGTPDVMHILDRYLEDEVIQVIDARRRQLIQAPLYQNDSEGQEQLHQIQRALERRTEKRTPPEAVKRGLDALEAAITRDDIVAICFELADRLCDPSDNAFWQDRETTFRAIVARMVIAAITKNEDAWYQAQEELHRALT